MSAIKIEPDPYSDAGRLAMQVRLEFSCEVMKATDVSQMPCRVSSDVHEWINDFTAVPA